MLQQVAPRGGLVRSSSLLFLGSGLGRLLGFLFSVAAARLLAPPDFGLLTYALAFANIAATLVNNAPVGLARFLARHRGEPVEQQRYFSHWLLWVAGLLGVSIVLGLPAGVLAGLRNWMLLGLGANLLGVAVYETYYEVQRGLENYRLMVGYRTLANLLQLGAVLAAGLLGWRDTSLFFTIYGLSSVAALLPMQWLAPLRLVFSRRLITLSQIKEISSFAAPLMAQTAFFAVWMGADIILVQRLLGSTAAGNYGAAKTLVQALTLAPGAVATASIARWSRLSKAALGADLLKVLGLLASGTAGMVAALAFFGRPLMAIVFGSKYPEAADPLTALAVGMGLYGLYLVLESAWIALGRPLVDTLATAAGMVVTLVTGVVFVPALGVRGAALAFAAGAAAKLVVIGSFTVTLYLPPRGGRAGRPPLAT